jgi:hypothetical protein
VTESLLADTQNVPKKKKKKIYKNQIKKFPSHVDCLGFFSPFFRFFKWVVLISIIGFLTDAASLRRVKSDLADFSVSLPSSALFILFYFPFPPSHVSRSYLHNSKTVCSDNWHTKMTRRCERCQPHFKAKVARSHSKWNRLCLH